MVECTCTHAVSHCAEADNCRMLARIKRAGEGELSQAYKKGFEEGKQAAAEVVDEWNNKDLSVDDGDWLNLIKESILELKREG